MKKTYRWYGPGDVGECADMPGLAYMLGGLRPYEQDAEQGLHLFKITLGKRDEKEETTNRRNIKKRKGRKEARE